MHLQNTELWNYYFGPQEEPCIGCGATWVDHGRDHHENCLLIDWVDEQDASK